MEEFAKTTTFILTANFPEKIIKPLQSRCSVVDFRVPLEERQTIGFEFIKRALDILTKENVTFNKRVVAGVVSNNFPDFRRVLNELQRFSASGTLSESILSQLSDKDVSELFDALKKQDFNAVRRWVVSHDDMEASAFYRMLTTMPRSSSQTNRFLNPSSQWRIIPIVPDSAQTSNSTRLQSAQN
jgi:DNA polymerase III delta prime subunit